MALLKKTAAILLVTLLVFNWLGYRFLSSYFEERANERLNVQLDRNDYDPSQLRSVKIPLSYLAYYNNSERFERSYGEIKINGVLYRFVEKRVYKDSLEFLCLPNNELMNLQSASNEFYKLVNGLQHTGMGGRSGSYPKNIKNSQSIYDLNSEAFHWDPFPPPPGEHYATAETILLAGGYVYTAEQPPEACRWDPAPKKNRGFPLAKSVSLLQYSTPPCSL